MATANVYLVHRSRASVRWRVLPLLDGANDMYVFALLVSNRDVGDLVVENEAVPIGVGLRFAVCAGKAIGLAQSGVGNLRAGGKIAQLWFDCQISGKLYAVCLHGPYEPSSSSLSNRATNARSISDSVPMPGTYSGGLNGRPREMLADGGGGSAARFWKIG